MRTYSVKNIPISINPPAIIAIAGNIFNIMNGNTLPIIIPTQKNIETGAEL